MRELFDGLGAMLPSRPERRAVARLRAAATQGPLRIALRATGLGILLHERAAPALANFGPAGRAGSRAGANRAGPQATLKRQMNTSQI